MNTEADIQFMPVRKVEIKILDERVKTWGLPAYQSDMAAAIDLHACLSSQLVIEPGAQASLIPAGISLHMANPNMAALILPRSGLGHKKGLVLGNGTGLIDPDYTGPIMVSAWNRGAESITIMPGDRIAQMMFIPVIRPVFQVVEEFSVASDRGSGGFGSTGHGVAAG